MKKISALLLVLIASSCAPGYYSLIGDYRPYVDKGFIFSKGDINQDYIPLGQVEVNTSYQYLNKAIEKIRQENSSVGTDTKRQITDDIYDAPAHKGNTLIYSGVHSDAFDLMLKYIYNECRKLGANGCVHLTIRYSNKGYTASGMAIKVK